MIMYESIRNIGPDSIHVAVGVVLNSKGQVLIAKRKDHVHQGGLWEFPGGKLEPGEDITRGLPRELEEELGITVLSKFPLIKVDHAYDDRRVILDVWQIESFQGEAKGLEGQPVRWVWPWELHKYSFPPADKPIVTAINLPAFYPFLDDESGNQTRMRESLQRMIKNGIKMIRLRATSLDASQYRNFVFDIARVCSENGVKLLLNAIPDLVYQAADVAGMHLTSKKLMEFTKRPLGENYWVAASCHNLQELMHAERIGVDFVVLSPVLPTPSHANAQLLGWEQFESMASSINLPVYALGGLSTGQLTEARLRGGQGISGISAFVSDGE